MVPTGKRGGRVLGSRALTALGATLFGGIGGSGVPAACVLLVLGWVDTPRYLALVSGSLAAYAFALWIAERGERGTEHGSMRHSDGRRSSTRLNWPDDWLRS